jgi:hypothetical protein
VTYEFDSVNYTNDDDYYDEQAELHLARQMFPGMTLAEAIDIAEQTDPWLIPGLVSATSTLIFGEAKIGKSWIVSHLIGALLTGGKFLDVDVSDRPFSVGVCYTDDAGHAEYADRIRSVVPDGGPHPVKLYPLGIMDADRWDALHRVVTAEGHNVVVIDNLTQVLNGSINEDAVVRRCFEGIRRFTHAGIAVVIVGHSSDKSGTNGYKPETPMGSAYITQAVRWLGFVRRTRNKNLALRTYGNNGYGAELVLQPEPGARFRVVSRREESDVVKETRQRDGATMDRNAEMADWVVANCQGLSQNKTAEKLESNFGGSAASYRSWLKPGGKLGALVQRDGDRWERVATRRPVSTRL